MSQLSVASGREDVSAVYGPAQQRPQQSVTFGGKDALAVWPLKGRAGVFPQSVPPHSMDASVSCDPREASAVCAPQRKY